MSLGIELSLGLSLWGVGESFQERPKDTSVEFTRLETSVHQTSSESEGHVSPSVGREEGDGLEPGSLVSRLQFSLQFSLSCRTAQTPRRHGLSRSLRNLSTFTVPLLMSLVCLRLRDLL